MENDDIIKITNLDEEDDSEMNDPETPREVEVDIIYQRY